MELGMQKCIKTIDRYLGREDSAPRLVNVDHPDQMKTLIDHYRVGGNRFLTVPQYSKPDEKAQTEALFHDLSTMEGNLFVTGFTTFWKLESEQELKKRLNTLLSLTAKGHLVIFCYQCRKFLQFSDPRLQRLVYVVNDGTRAVQPEIFFYSDDIGIMEGAEVISGIHNIPDAIETKVIHSLAVKTQKGKESFPHAQFRIVQEKSAYDVLCRMDASTCSLKEEWGTQEQWKYALQMFDADQNWIDVFQKKFHVSANLDRMLQDLTGEADETDWLYFIALKLLGASNRPYLQYVMNHSASFEEMISGIVRDLLDYQPEDEGFWKVYDERIKLLQSVEVSDELFIDYCKLVPIKREKGIYYLTDRSDEENTVLLQLLEQYWTSYDRHSLKEVLSHTNPSLAAYLNTYDFKNDLLNEYFTQYTWQKLTNHLSPEFEKLVEEQAEKREYNVILAPRASCIEDIPRRKTHAFFVDAMGVEFMGYITERCRELNLKADVRICRAEIPTITSQNKEFLEYFKQNGIMYANVKELDTYKHSGENDYDYSLTKLPLHLPKELDVIKDVLNKSRVYLLREQFDQIVLISDHGASRLAVIREHDLTVDVNAKGTHGGRVCSFSDNITSITKAVASDNHQYYVIANYDRFKGGRRPSVETHGGATLEELTVPIIVLTAMTRKVEIFLETTTIESDIKHPPIIKFYSITKLNNITVKIMEKEYPVTMADEKSFSVTMDKRTRKGTYKASVFSNGNVVAADLEFTIKKAGMRTRDIL